MRSSKLVAFRFQKDVILVNRDDWHACHVQTHVSWHNMTGRNCDLCRNCGEMKARKDYHRNHSKADELEDVCKPCKAQRDAARRRNRATVSTLASWLHFSASLMGAFT